MIFLIFISFIIIQRIVELTIAKKNEHRMKQKGAIEFGKEHYPFIIMLHSLFFVSLINEVVIFHKEMSSGWPFLFTLFLLTQTGRIWALYSLGEFWNTKILVLPKANIVRKGPYRFIKHPNYLVVTMEFLIIPLLFQAYMTAAIFSVLNAIVLNIRIRTEEKALKQLTEYAEAYGDVTNYEKNVNKV